jgi:hypothetical protein
MKTETSADKKEKGRFALVQSFTLRIRDGESQLRMLPDIELLVKNEVGMYGSLLLVSAVREVAEGEREQVCVCIYTHHICMYMHACIRIVKRRGGESAGMYVYIRVYTCIHIIVMREVTKRERDMYIHIYMHTCIRASRLIYIYIYTHMRMYIYIYIYIHTHTHAYVSV